MSTTTQVEDQLAAALKGLGLGISPTLTNTLNDPQPPAVLPSLDNQKVCSICQEVWRADVDDAIKPVVAQMLHTSRGMTCPTG
jgi:uncharacterized protein (DUF2237 family)